MTMRDSLVSIVLPVYNAGAFIEQAVASVIAQTYTDWELIIVDDGSTDKTCEIIREEAARDHRIRLIQLPQNTGNPAVPRNRGLEAANGRYIAFIDSDDIWLPQKLEEQLPLFADSDSVAIVYSDYEKIDENGKRDSRVIRNKSFSTYDSLLNGNVILQSSAIIDTSKTRIPKYRQVRHEDYFFWLDILRSGLTACNTGTVNTLYRVHSDSVSGNKLQTALWTWNIYRNEEHLTFWKSCYHFVHYIIYGTLKYLR